MLAAEADDCVCLAKPEPFYGVGAWYDDFSQLTDADVGAVLARADGARGAPAPSVATTT